MADTVKPEFKKAAGSRFAGTDAEYNDRVWYVAEKLGANIDGRTLNTLAIDDRDYSKALDFLKPR